MLQIKTQKIREKDAIFILERYLGKNKDANFIVLLGPLLPNTLKTTMTAVRKPNQAKMHTVIDSEKKSK